MAERAAIPGPRASAWCCTTRAGRPVAELSEYLGKQTNNYAEYSGLLAALTYALQHGSKALKVFSDSELMVKQIKGQYKVNNPALKELHGKARGMIGELDSFEITHVLREKNRDADRLANQAMDRGMGRGPDAGRDQPGAAARSERRGAQRRGGIPGDTVAERDVCEGSRRRSRRGSLEPIPDAIVRSADRLVATRPPSLICGGSKTCNCSGGFSTAHASVCVICSSVTSARRFAPSRVGGNSRAIA